MLIELAEPRILLLAERLSPDEAQARAWDHRIEGLGVAGRLRGFLNRPKDAEFQMTGLERRLEPFWRISCSASYAYDRRRDYSIRVGPEVRGLDLAGASVPITGGQFTLSGVEHCREEIRRVGLIDAVGGQPRPEYAELLNYGAAEASERTLVALATAKVIFVPPARQASAVVREVFAEVLHDLDADTVLEQSLRLEAVDLYLRPTYAFRYRWRNVRATIEVDALTGAVNPRGATLERYGGAVLSPEALLDVDPATAATLLPGLDTSNAVVVWAGEMAPAETRALL